VGFYESAPTMAVTPTKKTEMPFKGAERQFIMSLFRSTSASILCYIAALASFCQLTKSPILLWLKVYMLKQSLPQKYFL